MGIQQEGVIEAAVFGWEFLEWVAAGGIFQRGDVSFWQFRGQLPTKMPGFFATLLEIAEAFGHLSACLRGETKVLVSVNCLQFFVFVLYFLEKKKTCTTQFSFSKIV